MNGTLKALSCGESSNNYYKYKCEWISEICNDSDTLALHKTHMCFNTDPSHVHLQTILCSKFGFPAQLLIIFYYYSTIDVFWLVDDTKRTPTLNWNKQKSPF